MKSEGEQKQMIYSIRTLETSFADDFTRDATSDIKHFIDRYFIDKEDFLTQDIKELEGMKINSQYNTSRVFAGENGQVLSNRNQWAEGYNTAIKEIISKRKKQLRELQDKK